MSTPEETPARICLTGTAAAIEKAAEAGLPLSAAAFAVMVVEPPADAQETASLERVRTLADRHDLAFLLGDDIDMAALVGADGVEIDWTLEGYEKARAALGGERSIGCRVGLSRHDALEAAEAGADYVALTPAAPSDEDMNELIEMVTWWSEVVVVPCLARGARSADMLAKLTTAGADFVEVRADLASAKPGLVSQLVAGGAASQP